MHIDKAHSSDHDPVRSLTDPAIHKIFKIPTAFLAPPVPLCGRLVTGEVSEKLIKGSSYHHDGQCGFDSIPPQAP